MYLSEKLQKIRYFKKRLTALSSSGGGHTLSQRSKTRLLKKEMTIKLVNTLKIAGDRRKTADNNKRRGAVSVALPRPKPPKGPNVA